ncbi:MAG: Phycocyanobilin lyase subunit CpcU [Chroococcopsis gigantea SAG 12.99]|jgi:phycoerythrin-associated linker protein|nr:phycobiliprotein lyase [Chlorogloea purpurea SAG 13.99]MDV2998968.1 Phycocyanobilin lyase subunit CpcU [Chroococcopsis gigantea SAG 12.99]
MDVKEFMTSCVGKWFSQRTSYQITDGEMENNKSDLTIDYLEPDHPDVVNMCTTKGIDGNLCVGALKTSWDTSVDWGKPKGVGSTLLILLTDGQFLKSSAVGHYSLGKDSAITLTLQEKDYQTEERIWFAGENLRLRTSITQHSDGTQQTVFYSEIRKVTPPPSA